MFNGINEDSRFPFITKRFNCAKILYWFLSLRSVASKLPRDLSVIENVCKSDFKAYTKFLNSIPLYIILSADSDKFTGRLNGNIIGALVKNSSSS